MSEVLLHGVIPSIATPLTQAGEVDERSLRSLVQYLLRAGVHGFLANGTMGGFAFLNNDDQIRAISIVTNEVGGAVPIIGTIAETSTRRALRQLAEVQKCGVSCVAFLTPFYFAANQAHLISFYTEVTAATDLPVLLYDNPLLTKTRIKPETAAVLKTNLPQIIGIKESDHDYSHLQKLLDLTRDGRSFSVFTGTESLMLAGLEAGCSGSIAGLHNICPQLAVALYKAYCHGDLEAARNLQHDLDEVCHVFQYGDVWGGFEEALRYLGLADRVVGAPYDSKLTAAEAKQIHTIVDQFLRPSVELGK